MVSTYAIVAKGQELSREGKHREGARTLDEAVWNADSKGQKALPYVLNVRGVMYRMAGDFDLAFIDYRKALDSNPSKEQRALAHCNIADILRVGANKLDDALREVRTGIEYAPKPSLVEAKLYDQMGLVFVAQAKYGAAIQAYDRGHVATEKLLKKNPKDKDAQNRDGQISMHIGHVVVLNGDIGAAEIGYKALKRGLKIFRKQKDNHNIMNSLLTIGRIDAMCEDYNRAIGNYVLAASIADQLKDKRTIAVIGLDETLALVKIGQRTTAAESLKRFADGLDSGAVTKHDLNLMRATFTNIVAKKGLHKGLGRQAERVGRHFVN